MKYKPGDYIYVKKGISKNLNTLWFNLYKKFFEGKIIKIDSIHEEKDLYQTKLNENMKTNSEIDDKYDFMCFSENNVTGIRIFKLRKLKDELNK